MRGRDFTVKAFRQVLERQAALGNPFAKHYLKHKADKMRERAAKYEPTPVFGEEQTEPPYHTLDLQPPPKTEPMQPHEPSKADSFFDPNVDDGIPF